MSEHLFERENIDTKKRELDLIYNIINNYDLELNCYVEVLFTSGLEKRDINPLEKILQYLMDLEFYLKQEILSDIQKRYGYRERYVGYPYYQVKWPEEKQQCFYEWNDIISYEKQLLKALGSVEIEFYKILSSLRKQYTKTSFTSFIKGEASLLHLVSTNNHKFANIPKVSDDAFLFCCQFHNEGTPSMRVNSHNNTLKCYGCGIEYNVLSYIMAIEGLDYYHALALLAAIYKIEFRNNPYDEESELVKKYTNAYVLSKYKKRLETGYKRSQYKNKNLNNYLALKNYEREFALLERIKKGEYIKHDSKHKNKRLVYEMPEFNEQ
ncbi:MAG: CHC2 zinc finger domain-containing protein [Bacilli bacterium]|nr:CHC2 zinc finger domain-containing protein [Bacilli bacterium]